MIRLLAVAALIAPLAALQGGESRKPLVLLQDEWGGSQAIRRLREDH